MRLGIRLARTLLLLAMLLSVGLQWVVVQSAGWASMMVTYSHEYGYFSALEMTFDGAHPCALCKVAEKAAQDEDADGKPSDEQKLKLKKLELAQDLPVLLPPPTAQNVSYANFAQRAVTLTLELDDPPPRQSV
jgi:hypothetical protein